MLDRLGQQFLDDLLIDLHGKQGGSGCWHRQHLRPHVEQNVGSRLFGFGDVDDLEPLLLKLQLGQLGLGSEFPTPGLIQADDVRLVGLRLAVEAAIAQPVNVYPDGRDQLVAAPVGVLRDNAVLHELVDPMLR